MRCIPILTILLALACAGLACSSDPVPQPPAIVAPTLPQVPGAPQAPGTPPVTITPPTGTPPPGGDSQVLTDGRPVWPPTGPGCDRYVACCQEAGAMASDLGLACQLTVATPPVDCAAALTSIRTMITQGGRTPPPACAP